MAYFKSKNDLESCALAIAKVMAKWGLEYDQWMIGKTMSFYFDKIITNPRVLSRDVNLYILYIYLPWKCRPDPAARIIFPPKNTSFAADYYDLQKQVDAGVDLMPIPDSYLRSDFIQKKSKSVLLNGQEINFETIEKFIFRIDYLSRELLAKPVAKLRDFYFADKKRYQARLNLYARLRRGISDPALGKRMDGVTKSYQLMMKRAYPEIFNSGVSISGQNKRSNFLAGTVSFYEDKMPIITGRIKPYNPKLKYQSTKDKSIYCFSHFYPADTKILPYAKAILTEGGGLLCHAAIVCREEKIPCIVGVKGLMARIKAGQAVSINFLKGTIKLI